MNLKNMNSELNMMSFNKSANLPPIQEEKTDDLFKENEKLKIENDQLKTELIVLKEKRHLPTDEYKNKYKFLSEQFQELREMISKVV